MVILIGIELRILGFGGVGERGGALTRILYSIDPNCIVLFPHSPRHAALSYPFFLIHRKLLEETSGSAADSAHSIASDWPPRG